MNVRLRPEKGAGQELTLRWQWKEGKLEIRNLSAYPLLLDHIRVAGQVQDLSMMIAPESAFSLRVEAPARGEVTLAARIVREGDMLLPRNRAIVRYAADLPDFLAALDVGVTLSPPEERDEETARLQRELKKRPGDPAIAAALARHLLQQGKLDEAERYYRQALRSARSLPDGGERVQLELAQLQMYREDGGGLAS
jgi:tetratricopeptide (TPR) repeat protein